MRVLIEGSLWRSVYNPDMSTVQQKRDTLQPSSRIGGGFQKRAGKNCVSRCCTKNLAAMLLRMPAPRAPPTRAGRSSPKYVLNDAFETKRVAAHDFVPSECFALPADPLLPVYKLPVYKRSPRGDDDPQRLEFTGFRLEHRVTLERKRAQKNGCSRTVGMEHPALLPVMLRD
jgi:hypothetical protein